MSNDQGTFFKIGKFFGRNPRIFFAFLAVIFSLIAFIIFDEWKRKHDLNERLQRIANEVNTIKSKKPRSQIDLENQINIFSEKTKTDKIKNPLEYVPLYEEYNELLCNFNSKNHSIKGWVGELSSIERGINNSARITLRLNDNLYITNEFTSDNTDVFSENFNELLKAAEYDFIIFNGDFGNSKYLTNKSDNAINLDISECNSITSNIVSAGSLEDSIKKYEPKKLKFNFTKIKVVTHPAREK
jgi:hypothetical protein